MSTTTWISTAIESLFNIYDKHANLVPFKLNATQKYIDQHIVKPGLQNPRNRKHCILKFRQGGCSSFILAWFAVECMTRHTMAVVIAHREDATQRLLRRVQMFLKNLKVQAKTSRSNEQEIAFPKTDSLFYIGTAGSKGFGRGDYITHLHMSEVAFWPDPKQIRAGLLQACTPDAWVIEETTSSGYGTWFHQHYKRLVEGQTDIQPHFLPWNIQEEYRLNLASTFVPTPEEQQLMQQHGLTLEQIAWRRYAIENLCDGDLEIFKREYPLTVDDCFLYSGNKVFPIPLKFTSELQLRSKSPWLEVHPDHPQPNATYILGVDCAGGTGLDHSAIVGLCADTFEVVLVYDDPFVPPSKFAEHIYELGMQYNQAWLVIERNAHGAAVNSFVRQAGYPTTKMYKHSQPTKYTVNVEQLLGFKTTKSSKPYAVNIAKKLLEEGLEVRSALLARQLVEFEETADNKLEGVGEHDDLAMAFILACVGLSKVGRQTGSFVEEARPSKLYCPANAIPVDDIFQPGREALGW